MSKYNLTDLYEGMSDQEFADAKEQDRLEKHPESDTIKKIQKLMSKEKEIEEVTSREGSRIEGLLSQPLKVRFLEAFEELYFDLVEEDPFAAEDVVDHLANQMLIHLDDIQAQGDRLAGLEETEEIDEVESVEEGISKGDIKKALKGTEVEIEAYMDSLKRSGDKFDSIEDYVEDFENYVADKSLQEHFGRFMKDYQ